MNDKKYFFYKTTYTKDNRYYYGSHHGTEDDDYMGSNKIIKSIQNKHGNKYLIREVLKYFDNKEDMFAFEGRFLRYYNICSDVNSLNFTNNGCGGDTYDCMTEKQKIIRNRTLSQKNSGEKNNRFGKTYEEIHGVEKSTIIKQQIAESKIGVPIHSEDYLKILSERRKMEYETGIRDKNFVKQFANNRKGKTVSDEIKQSDKYINGHKRTSQAITKKYINRLNDVKNMIDSGYTDKEIIDFFNIAKSTMYAYKRDIKKRGL